MDVVNCMAGSKTDKSVVNQAVSMREMWSSVVMEDVSHVSYVTYLQGSPMFS